MFVSRAELFDLVWSQPRTKLAIRFKVSDVALAKKCRSANIPMPPAGYWARVAAGARLSRLELPLRLPGEKDVIAVREPRYASAPTVDTGELQPPYYAESVDTLVDAAVKQLGRVLAQRDIADAHSGLARVLRKEEERRKKFAEMKWSYYKPKFDDASSQRQLRLYSAIFRALAKLGIKGAVSEEQQWKQGVGTTDRLSGSLEFGGAVVTLFFVAAEAPSKTTKLKLLVGGDTDGQAHSVWSDEPQLPLEKQLDSIVRSILVCAEDRMREHAQRSYEWALEGRERRKREREEQRLAENARLAAQAAREQQLRLDSLIAAASRRQRAVEIRALVTALKDTHPNLVGDDRFANWCSYALGEADRIDPTRSDWRELLQVTGVPAASKDLDHQ